MTNDRWVNHYKEKLNGRYKRYINRRYADFICEIANYINGRSFTSWNVLELGCGISSITWALYQLCGKHYYSGMDNSVEMLKLSYINLNNAGVVENNDVELIRHDIRNFYPFKQFDVVHSHGVLEHFSDEEIQAILKHNRSAAHFHYVPSAKYTTKTMGDERLLTPDYWRKLTKMNVIEFNEGYDLIITNIK